MADNLVTVATFSSPVEAQIAKNALEEEGIKAMIADEETVGMAWHLGNAIGGVKLLVLDNDWMKARVILADHQEKLDEEDDFPADEEMEEEPDEHFTERPDQRAPVGADDIDRQIADKPMRRPEQGLEEPEPIIISPGEDLAGRAFRAAIFGLILPFIPIFQLYSAWLLLKLFRWDGELSDSATSKALLAMVLDGAVLGLFAILFFVLARH